MSKDYLYPFYTIINEKGNLFSNRGFAIVFADINAALELFEVHEKFMSLAKYLKLPNNVLNTSLAEVGIKFVTEPVECMGGIWYGQTVDFIPCAEALKPLLVEKRRLSSNPDDDYAEEFMSPLYLELKPSH